MNPVTIPQRSLSQPTLEAVLADILALTRAVYEVEHSFHWRTRGPDFFSIHGLFTKLYETSFVHMDGLAEKCIGITGSSDTVEAVYQSQLTAQYVADLGPAKAAEGFVQSALAAEMLLMQALDDTLKHPSMTQGLSNFLQGMADAHETSIYLLKQSL